MSTSFKPSRPEDEYFARQEVEKMKRLAAQVNDKFAKEEREKLKQFHHMHCGKCGMDMQTVAFQGFIIDKCFSCGAVLLEQSEFEKLAGDEVNVIDNIVGLFK